MKVYKIRLNTIDKVKSFVSSVEQMDGSYEIIADAHVINAKSILGIFSLDLSKILDLRTAQEKLPSELKVFLA